MTIDTSIPRTRRALLAGGIGGLAALVASALGRPLPARAGSDGDVVLGVGNTATTTTAVSNFTTSNTAFAANCSLGDALRGTTSGAGRSGLFGVSNVASGHGVRGRCDAGNGVYATSISGDGVYATSDSGNGVYGRSSSRDGVYGKSDSGYGVYGGSDSGNGVVGTSTWSCGVLGKADSGPGVYGSSNSREGVLGIGNIGVQGYGGSSSPAAPPGRTGVFGYAAQDANARGVFGQSTAGRGVHGQATTGCGVYAIATTGYALRAVGRVKLDKCAGVATIAATKSSVVVTPGIDLVATSAVVATLQGSAGSATTTVSRCLINATTNTFTIYLTKAATVNVKVAWHVFG